MPCRFIPSGTSGWSEVTREERELLIVVGVGLLLMLTKEHVEWGDPSLWSFPVPDANLFGVKYPALVSHEFSWPAHHGVDIEYRSVDPSALGFADHASGEWFAPADTPVLAARAGKVRSVDRSERGVEIVLDHGPPFATYYQHLALASVKQGDEVAAGQRIGVMGFDPTQLADADHGLRHLHFEVWYQGGPGAAVDPQAAMASWKRTLWTRGEGAETS